MPAGSLHKVRIWDLPTRLFHWLLALAAVGLLVTGKIGGDAMAWHARLGYCVGALVLFRLAWGALGGHWSRFSSFAFAPRGAWNYLRGRLAAPGVGHNPLGALSVYAMLGFVLLQFASGLFSETKDDFSGPLAVLVSNGTVHWLTGYHRNVGQWVLIGLVVLHLAAISYHALHGENLVGPMVNGDKHLPEAVPASRDDAGSRVRALALLAVCAAAVWGLVRLGG
jgi:cytochrome b